MSLNNRLHLMDSEDSRSQTWLTLCGRKIRATHALPLQKFDAGENCCTVCVRMQRSNSLLHSRFKTA
ncbi:hypothetical protein [uncultured Nostoc sp.]|uniref:hypothetical protein n=1 Tax=uncultured Nostoc sp. TaxID=340711 RepID=UPI0035C97042